MARIANLMSNSALISGKVTEEIKKMEHEAILPVEKKLLGWSFGIGTGLIVVLYWLSAALFPVVH